MLAATTMAITSCLGDNVEDTYKDWRETNQKWFNDQAMKLDDNGKAYYELITAPWDPNARVYMHWFNDREATKGNLSPIFSSMVDVKYIGRTCDGMPFDSSYLSTSPRDSIFRTTLTDVVEGWAIAITKMHVGDSCRIVINYPQAYGSYSKGPIKPFSVLEFDVKLDDIYAYEVKP